MKDVIISITGVQQDENGPNTLELVTRGQYSAGRGEYSLTYQETELTGMEGTNTCFTVKPQRVEVTREGTVNTNMVFEEGQKHYFLYETPFGSTTMGLSTNRIRYRLGEHGGDMEIDYSIHLDQTVVGRNRFFIHIREPEESHTGDIRWPI